MSRVDFYLYRTICGILSCSLYFAFLCEMLHSQALGIEDRQYPLSQLQLRSCSALRNLARSWKREVEGEEAEEGGRHAALIESRGPHLAGG